MHAALTVEAPRATQTDGRSVVTTLVGGHPLWFSSADAALDPTVEAVACALVVAAARHEQRLTSTTAVSPLWLGHHERRALVLRRWWGLEALRPVMPVAAVDGQRPHARTALCFSGGADSLHVLRASGRRVDDVVLVHGYDVALQATTLAARVERSVRAVAAASGAEVIVVRTNLREHPVFDSIDWGWAHGGALAAVGHLLTGRIGRLLVAASFPHDDDSPWGSHWRLDPLWSSERLEVAHVGAELWRSEKLRELAFDPVAQRHLRVCWQAEPGPTGNCGHCEKCVRTMLVLAQCGGLADFPVFPLDGPLARRVSALPAIGGHIAPVYVRLLSGGLSEETAVEVRALLERSA